MSLSQENFKINMILVNSNQINSFDITDKILRFTNTNSSQVMGTQNIKYKIMFENLELPNDVKLDNLYIKFPSVRSLNTHQMFVWSMINEDYNYISELIEYGFLSAS